MRARLKPHPHFFLSAIYATRPIETVTHAQVNYWVEKNVGTTVHAKRCKIFRKLKKYINSRFSQKLKKKAQELTGISRGDAVGF